MSNFNKNVLCKIGIVIVIGAMFYLSYYNYVHKRLINMTDLHMFDKMSMISDVLIATTSNENIKNNKSAEILNKVNVQQGSGNIIINSSGGVEFKSVGFYSSEENMKKSDFYLEEFFKNAEIGKKGKFLFEYNGKSMAMFFCPIGNFEYNLISVIPCEYFYSEIYKITYAVIFIIVIVSVAAITVILCLNKLRNKLKMEKKKTDIVINTSNISILKVNIDGIIINFNDNILKLTGYDETEFQRKKIYDIIPEQYYKQYNEFLSGIINGKDFVKQIDMPIVNCDGKWIYILWGYNVDDEFVNIELIGTDISKFKEYERKIQRIAYFDQLTGLKNLTYLEEYFNSVVELNTKNTKMALIYIDVDNFKYINDMFGHNIGDNIIIDICSKIDSIENPKVKVCKRGGDELVVFYEYIEKSNEIEKYINSVEKIFEQEFYINNVKLSMSASIGVSIYPDDGVTYTELFKCANIALSAAKDSGIGKVKYFNNSMKNDIYQIIEIESELKTAIENDEFVLYFQPQYNIENGQLYGFESLIRWKNPRSGFIQPNKFIPQAEKNQLIIPIGKWALEKTCDFINEAKKKGFDDICVSVNVSVVQMMCDDFVDTVIDIIQEKNIDPKNIKLEITESVLIKSIEDMLIKIKQLNNKGVYFSLDDFGTGYSSLSYLKKIPIKVLKIDKSFVDTIIEDDGNKEILSLIINLAHDFNLEIVAEGIEDPIQLKWLDKKGCNIAQGFYMGKPMPWDNAVELLGKNMYENLEEEKKSS